MLWDQEGEVGRQVHQLLSLPALVDTAGDWQFLILVGGCAVIGIREPTKLGPLLGGWMPIKDPHLDPGAQRPFLPTGVQACMPHLSAPNPR